MKAMTMNDVLTVKNLSKKYPAFNLQNVSFNVQAGHIMGFIGRNGAGKSTTLKAILNLVHPDSGQIKYFGQDFLTHETAIKRQIGFANSTFSFYPKKRIGKLIEITSRFYPNWDKPLCQHYLRIFALDPQKRPDDLSAGMRVKLNLLLALSHHARLSILDEPTSGLDPVSRSELLTIFQALKKKGITILFSTHITSDLENCADDLTYISHGQIVASQSLTSFMQAAAKAKLGHSIQEIMIHYEQKREQHENFAF